MPFIAAPISPADSVAGYGPAEAEVILGPQPTLHLVFGAPAALPDGTIPIEALFSVGTPVANMLGYKTLRVLSGVYAVDFSTHPTHGEANLAVELGMAAVPATSGWGTTGAAAMLVAVAGALMWRRSRTGLRHSLGSRVSATE